MTTIEQGELQRTLANFLPFYVNKPFSESPRIDVAALRQDVGFSHETVYRWLNTDKLSTTQVDRIVATANAPANLAVLQILDRRAPTREDFNKFLYVKA